MTHPPVSKPKVRNPEIEARGALLARIGDEPPIVTPPASLLRAPVQHFSLRVKLRRAGVKRAGVVLAAARKHNLPVALQVAVLDQETGIPQRNIFGCDWGPQGGQPPYCQDTVTNRRVRKMHRSGKPNGVGWPQLTWPDFVERAMRLRGGAARPRNQLRVGADVLRDDISGAGSVWGGLVRYNGSAAYANEVLARYHDWHDRLT